MSWDKSIGVSRQEDSERVELLKSGGGAWNEVVARASKRVGMRRKRI